MHTQGSGLRSPQRKFLWEFLQLDYWTQDHGENCRLRVLMWNVRCPVSQIKTGFCCFQCCSGMDESPPKVPCGFSRTLPAPLRLEWNSWPPVFTYLSWLFQCLNPSEGNSFSFSFSLFSLLSVASAFQIHKSLREKWKHCIYN